MAILSSKEAEELAAVFGSMDDRMKMVLMVFCKQRSKYDVLCLMKPGRKTRDRESEDPRVPEAYRVPRATLYRKIDELRHNYFIEEVPDMKRKLVRGRLQIPVVYYHLSFKGTLALYFHLHKLLLQMSAPSDASLEEKKARRYYAGICKQLISQLEADDRCKMYVESLRWHRRVNADLSRVNMIGDWWLYWYITSDMIRETETATTSNEALRSLHRESQK
jgi:hypothetical protein